MPMQSAVLPLPSQSPALPDFKGSAGGSPLPLPPTSYHQQQAAPSGQSPFPSPDAPATPPWNVELQGDGSSVYTIPGPDGKPIVIGINPVPKLPKALQAQPTAA